MKFEELKSKYPLRLGEGGMESPESYVVVLDEDKAFRMTAAAFYVWYLCDGSRTCGEILDTISSETNIEPSELEEPLAEIFTALSEAGLIKFGETPIRE